MDLQYSRHNSRIAARSAVFSAIRTTQSDD
jgi:hypothetical protein